MWDVVATGFDGGFIALGPKRVGNGLGEKEQQSRVERVDEILKKWWEVQPHHRGEGLDVYAKRNFADLAVCSSRISIDLCMLFAI